MKNSIKRAQSQAGLSFAERKNFRPKVKQEFSRYIMTLVALFAMTAGAWAQGTDEVTMTKSTTVKNTWTFTMLDTNVELEAEYYNLTAPTANTADIYAGSSTALINAGETTETGATMKYMVTATDTQPTSTEGFSAKVPTAQDQAINGAGTYYVWYYVKGDDEHSDSKISATAIAVTVKAPRATITTDPAAVGPIYISTDVSLITGGETSQGTLMYFAQISTADAPTSTTGFSTDLPSAKEITEPGTYNVYYYIVGDEEHSDSEIFGPISVSVLTDKYDITFNAANNYTIDGDNSKGTVKVNGTDKTLDAEHKLKAVKMGSTVTINAATGYKFRSVKAAKKKPIATNPSPTRLMKVPPSPKSRSTCPPTM